MESRDVKVLVFVLCCVLLQLFSNMGVTLASQASGSKFDLTPNGGKRLTVTPNDTITLTLLKCERSWRFAVFHAHTQYRNVALSTDPSLSYGTTDIGSDTSVLMPLPIMTMMEYPVYLRSKDFHADVKLDVISVPYKVGAPFPGACCLTCSMEFDPNLTLNYTSVETTIIFSFANVFYQRNVKVPPCDGNFRPGLKPEHFRLEYYLYQMFLDEGNLSEDELFNGVEKMAYPHVIKTNGKKVNTIQAPNLPLVKLQTQNPGQGVVYNIIVYDPHTKKEAAYSPVVTYGCSFTSKVNSCQAFGATINAIFSVVGAVIGVVMCFFGHRLFKIALFLGSLVNFAFIFFIIFSTSTDIDHLGRMLLSTCLGMLCGLFIFGFWWFTECHRLCLLFNGLFLGLLVGATIFFTPLGDRDLWRTSDFDYGAVLSAITIIVPVVMVPWPVVLSIVYTSVVSAYGFVIGIDFFIHTNLSSIIVDVLLRATEPQYHKDQLYVRRPFQRNDYVLSVTWIVLALLGIGFQFYSSRGRPHFPPSPYMEQKRIRKYYDRKEFDERTPILINDDTRPNNIC